MSSAEPLSRTARPDVLPTSARWRRTKESLKFAAFARFAPLETHFAGPAWRHFWQLVLDITVGHCSTIDRLAELRNMIRNVARATGEGSAAAMAEELQKLNAECSAVEGRLGELVAQVADEQADVPTEQEVAEALRNIDPLWDEQRKLFSFGGK